MVGNIVGYDWLKGITPTFKNHHLLMNETIFLKEMIMSTSNVKTMGILNLFIPISSTVFLTCNISSKVESEFIESTKRHDLVALFVCRFSVAVVVCRKRFNWYRSGICPGKFSEGDDMLPYITYLHGTRNREIHLIVGCMRYMGWHVGLSWSHKVGS